LLFRVLLAVIAFLILFATGLHIIYGHKHDLTMDDVPPVASSEPILSRTTIINASPAPNHIDDRDHSTSSDEITPLLTRSEGQVDSGKD
jgi:hypothetical protein